MDGVDPERRIRAAFDYGEHAIGYARCTAAVTVTIEHSGEHAPQRITEEADRERNEKAVATGGLPDAHERAAGIRNPPALAERPLHRQSSDHQVDDGVGDEPPARKPLEPVAGGLKEAGRMSTGVPVHAVLPASLVPELTSAARVRPPAE